MSSVSFVVWSASALFGLKSRAGADEYLPLLFERAPSGLSRLAVPGAYQSYLDLFATLASGQIWRNTLFHPHVFKLPFSAWALLFHLLLSSGPNFKCTAWALPSPFKPPSNFEHELIWTQNTIQYTSTWIVSPLYHCISCASTASTMASAWIRSGLNTTWES